jgi:flagellar biosynthesis protein FlhB
MAGDKTERPTPRRRQKAREKGQVARSRELAGSLSALAAIVLLAWLLPGWGGAWRAMLREQMERAVLGEMGLGDPVILSGGLRWLSLAAGIMAFSWLVAVLSSVAQGGLVVAPSALAPSLPRLSPAAKMKQLFSIAAAGRLLKSLIPVAAMVYLAGQILVRDWRLSFALLRAPGHALVNHALSRIFEMAWKSGLVLLLWSGVDYLLERQKLEGELRMSRQELVDEYKETEGHPTVKARIRRLQRQARRRRMLKDVERAAVVVTNPTHFAVALEFQPEMAAPVVVAKGCNLIAQQIKQVALWHGIPLVENPPLAQVLYRAVEIGQSIPPKLFAVVAEILAAIYRAQARATAASASPAGRS